MNRSTIRLTALLVAVILFSSACGRDALREGAIHQTQTPTTKPAPTNPPLPVPEPTPTSAPEPTVVDIPEGVPDGEHQAETPTPTTTSTTTTTVVPEPEQVWVDLPDAEFVRIDSIGTYAPMEITQAEDNVFDPDGPNIGLIGGVAPCELGTSWLLGHSNTTGATPWLVVNPEDHADERARATGNIGIQLGDIIEIELVDGTGCRYEVVPFNTDKVVNNVEVVSVAGSPALAWPKSSFCEGSEFPHPPSTEWYWPQEEAILYLSTSGGWPTITKCNGKTGRPNVDTVMAVLVDSDHPPQFAQAD